MAEEKKGPPQGGGGSRKGKPNRVTKELKDMILGALDKKGGQKYLEKQADENPVAFMSLVAKTLPRDINANVTLRDETEGMSKEELKKWASELISKMNLGVEGK